MLLTTKTGLTKAVLEEHSMIGYKERQQTAMSARPDLALLLTQHTAQKSSYKTKKDSKTIR